MFRKYYKEANIDLNPKEELINRVIENAHKKQSPSAVKRYYRYAASLAAAVVAVSAVIISMPFFEHTGDDGVIIEKSVVETASPRQDSTTASNDSRNAAEPTLPENNTEINNFETDASSKHSYDYTDSNSASSMKEHSSVAESAEDSVPRKNSIKNEANTERNTDNGGLEDDSRGQGEYRESAAVTENPQLKKEVADMSDDETPPDRTPPPAVQKAATFASGGIVDSGVAENIEVGISRDETLLPTPYGYQCEKASWNGYTFVSEKGAVINVVINYGGEENSEPYYSVDGNNIYASFTACGMTVTVSASGANMSTVEEIINSLR